jgi:hypothetical protein
MAGQEVAESGTWTMGASASSAGACTPGCWAGVYQTLVDAKRTTEGRRRRVLLVRNAERLDRIFPHTWERLTGPSGAAGAARLCLTDLNLPRRLPADLAAGDTPITPLGQAMAQMLGEGLRLRGITPHTALLLSSPSLRCLQTAAAIAQGLAPPDASAASSPQLLIKVEPGLCTALPSHFQGAETLAQLGIQTDPDYKPFLAPASLRARLTIDEGPGAWTRELWDSLLGKMGGKELVAVTEAAGVEAGARELLCLPASAKRTGPQLGLAYPPASLTLLEERRRGSFRFVPNDVLPISFLHTSNAVRNPLLFN